MPLLSEVRWGDDEDAPFPLRPFLGDHQARLDGLAQPDFVGEHCALGEGRLEGEQGRVDLMRVKIDLCVDESAGELLDAVGRNTASSARGRSTSLGSR